VLRLVRCVGGGHEVYSRMGPSTPSPVRRHGTDGCVGRSSLAERSMVTATASSGTETSTIARPRPYATGCGTAGTHPPRRLRLRTTRPGRALRRYPGDAGRPYRTVPARRTLGPPHFEVGHRHPFRDGRACTGDGPMPPRRSAAADPRQLTAATRRRCIATTESASGRGGPRSPRCRIAGSAACRTP